MPTNIDELQIEINAKSQKANDALENLIGKIDRLSTSLGKIDSSSLSGLASGVNLLGTAMQSMNNVKTTDFTRLARNLQNLSNINTSGLNTTAVSITQFATALNGFGPVSANAQAVGDMAKNIAKLGNKSVQTAITNMPQLASSLNNLMVTLSRSPQVSQNVIQMTNALANLASQGSKVNSASNTITAGLNKTTTATYKASSGFKGLASYIGKFYAKYFLVVRSIKKMWSSIEGTADYIEAYNYFNVAMGKIGSDWSYQYEKYGYENAETYSESFEKRLSESIGKLSGLNIEVGADGKGLLTESGMQNLGLNIQEITQYASQLASITNSVGQTGETSLAISSSFTKLAGDISSLFNVDYSSVSKNLQSGLIGQSRALYKYGIDITNATLQTKAYELGLSKAVSEMTQAEKMQLRTLAILEQSKVSWGDLANTITSPSNMIRQLSNNLKETGMVLGQLFIPMLSNVLPIANGVTIALKRMLVEIAGFFGVKIDLDKFGQGYTELEDDLGGITDGYEDVTAAVKEWQNQVMKFDEINKLSDNTDVELGSVTGGEIDLTDKILDATTAYEDAWNECFANMENTSAKWADKVEKALAGVGKVVEDFAVGDFFSAGEDVSQLVIDFNNFIAKAISNVDWDGLGENVGKFLRGIKWIDVFKSLSNVFTSAWNGAWDAWFGSLKESPFETLLLTSIGLMNIDPIRNCLLSKLSTMSGLEIGKLTPLKIGVYVSVLFLGIEIAEDLGEKIGKLLVGEITDPFKYINIISENEKKLEDITNQYNALNGEIDKYLELSANYDNLSDEDKGYVKQMGDDLAANIDGIKENIDSITGAWSGTNEELENAVKNQMYYTKIAANQELIQDLYSQLGQLEREFIRLHREYADYGVWGLLTEPWNVQTTDNAIYSTSREIESVRNAITQLELQNTYFENQINRTGDSLDGAAKLADDFSVALDKDKQALWNLQFAPNRVSLFMNSTDFDTKLGNSTMSISEFNSTYGKTETTLDINTSLFTSGLVTAENDLNNAVIKMNSNIPVMGVGIDTSGAEKAYNDSVARMNNNKPNMSVDVDTSKAENSVKKLVDNMTKSLKGITVDLGITTPGTSSLKNQWTTVSIKAYASGGFPEDGLFMANHGELVGKFSNGRTAVANNGQITEGIRQAAYEGMKMALSEYQGGNTNVNVTLQGDAKKMFRTMQTEANNYTMQTGKPAFKF